MNSFLALRVHNAGGVVESRLDMISLDDLSPGNVVVRVVWSGINYKDALAATGKGKIMRRFPMVGGIDLAGYVETSGDPALAPGDAVVVTGCGLGEERDGGYSRYVRVPSEIVVRLPKGLTMREAMAIGCAGFTSALAVDRMQHNGLVLGNGPVLVNGATGGVGSYAIDMLASLGFEVTAFTGKREQEPYLRHLGASNVIVRGDVTMGTKPLEKGLWAGAVDNVGGDELAWLTRTVKFGGSIASIGLAGGFKLETTVMPFILRGVNLLGIDSVHLPMASRLRVWERVSGDLRPRHIEEIAQRTVALEQLPPLFEDYVAGRVTGRTLVKISDE